MSVEITSLLSSLLGSGALAEVLVKLYKSILKEKRTIEDINISSDLIVAEGAATYLTGEEEINIATNAAIEALDLTYISASNIRDERMRQAKVSFNVAVLLLIFGVLIIFTGVVLLFLKEKFESGLITVAVGSISEVISALVLKFNKETNNRLDKIHKDLSTIEAARIGLSIAKQIEDQEKRDNAISELSNRISNK